MKNFLLVYAARRCYMPCSSSLLVYMYNAINRPVIPVAYTAIFGVIEGVEHISPVKGDICGEADQHGG